MEKERAKGRRIVNGNKIKQNKKKKISLGPQRGTGEWAEVYVTRRRSGKLVFSFV